MLRIKKNNKCYRFGSYKPLSENLYRLAKPYVQICPVLIKYEQINTYSLSICQGSFEKRRRRGKRKYIDSCQKRHSIFTSLVTSVNLPPRLNKFVKLLAERLGEVFGVEYSKMENYTRTRIQS